MKPRIETDQLGEKALPADCPWGIHTARALDNFPIPGKTVSPRLITAYFAVKKACALANKELGYLAPEKADSIITAVDEFQVSSFKLPLSALQGGAGTSTNMMVNELIGLTAGAHPIEEVNLHQSTNDTYPTALKVAAIRGVRDLSEDLAKLQGVFQTLEKTWATLPVLGKTELVDAVPLPLGAQFASFAEAFAHDRWRTFKCEERLRTVNLGGTAIGTGLTAPRSYIFLVIEKLREETGLGLSRAENMIEATANADCFVEVSGILNAAAVNFIKVGDDLRRLAMLGEIRLPAVQAGSSIMPGKVNPVILESIIQIGIKVKANNTIISDCVARGSLQICEFMPLLADALLESIDLLVTASRMLAKHAEEIDADQGKCLERLYASPEIITAFVPMLGYDRCAELFKQFEQLSNGTIREFLEKELGKQTVEKVLSPQNLMSLGHK
ncbi:lyase family protein [Tichowtungia aerotolerans]|uniref:Aspartate ammonia-lyase n=1 Tax=Tichowtungia aerotolerans TaxID=2697043 RepID=A0A6P1MCV2_9BACT|nr:lyase family protein [Tichowtungia aerotolerans]QHI69888.1 aspartate ammonia-lyase [Tichowtungia aerotolerans]